MAARIRKGDKVVVITGKDKGKTGEVLGVMAKDGRALVGGINMGRRHQKQQAGEQCANESRSQRSLHGSG